MKIIFRRFVCFSLLIALLCAGTVSLAAEKQNADFYVDMKDYNNPDRNDQKSVMYASAVGDTLYILTYSTLEKWEPDFVEPEVLMEYGNPDSEDQDSTAEADSQENGVAAMIGYSSRLFSDGQSVYVLRTDDGRVWKLADETGAFEPATQCELDWSSFINKDNEYSSTPYIQSMVAMDGMLFIAAFDYEKGRNNPDLFQWDLQTGKAGKTIENCPVQYLAPYKDGLLLCVLIDMDNYWDEAAQKANPTKLGTLNPQTGETAALLELGTDSYTGLCYNPDNDTAYYLTGSTLMSLPGLALPAKVSAYTNSTSWGGGSYGLLKSGMYYKADYDGCSIRGLDMPGVEKGALTIYGSYANRAHMTFATAHPEISTILSTAYYDTLEAFTNAMVSGANAGDVLYVSASYTPFTRLVEKGYAMDLSGNAEIMAVADAIYPAFTDFCKKDGALYALPISAYAYTYGYDSEVWTEELGLAEDDLPTSFYGLLDFVENWEADYADDHPDIKLFENASVKENLLRKLMEDYIAYCKKQNQPLDFDTELFTKLMAKLDGIDFTSVDDAVLENDDDYNEFYNQRYVFSEYGYCMQFYTWSGATLLPLPLDEGLEPVIPAYLTVIFINPRTPRAEQAMLYLANCARYYEEDNENISLFPGHNDAVPNRNFEKELENYKEWLEDSKKMLETAEPENQAVIKEDIKYYEERIASADERRFLVTEETITFYRENIAPYLYVVGQTPMTTWDNEGNNDLYTQMQLYLEGATPADRFIKEISKRVRMMELEDQ